MPITAQASSKTPIHHAPASLHDPSASMCRVEFAAILFDLDGVLVDSTASVERLWRAFAQRHGLDVHELLADLHGRRMVDILGAALPDVDVTTLAAEIEQFDAAEAADARSTVVLAGAHELTRQLQDHDVPWAIVTSGTAAVAAARISAVGLGCPEVLVTAEQVAAGKPSPEPYLAAADRLGVSATRCLVIEDAPAGVRAGNAAGAVTVAVSSSHPPAELAHADYRIGSLADVVLSVQSAGGPAAVEFPCSAPAARRTTG